VAHRPARRASRARLWQRRLERGGDRGGRDIRWAPRHWPRGSVRLRRNFYDAPVELGTHVDAFHWGVTAVAVLSDGCVVTAGSDWRVRLWRTDQPGVPIEIGTHDGEVTAVAVLSDGSVVTGGRDGRVRLWRTDQPGVPMALSADDDDQMDKLVTTVHMLPDGHVVTCSRTWRGRRSPSSRSR
jgi:WD40 repeat protein